MVHALPVWSEVEEKVVLGDTAIFSLKFFSKKKKSTHVGLVCYLEPFKILDLLIKKFCIPKVYKL